jgi:hypothetical protein
MVRQIFGTPMYEEDTDATESDDDILLLEQQ